MAINIRRSIVVAFLFGMATPICARAEHRNPKVHEQWVLMTEHADFSPRDTAHGAVFRGRMWLSHAYPERFLDLWSSADGVFWTPVDVRTPYEEFSSLVAYDQQLWAIHKCSIWSSADGHTWKHVLEDAPFDTIGEALAYDGKMWMITAGGEVWWSTDGQAWTSATKHAAFGARAAPAVAVFAGRLWVMGGSTPAPNRGYGNPEGKGYADIQMNNDVWSSRDGTNWTRVTAHAPWAGRMWFSAQSYAGRLWILAGYENDSHTNLGDVWYTSDGVDWSQWKSSESWAPRHFPATYVFKQSLWLAGGNAWPFMNDVWRIEVHPPVLQRSSARR